MHQATDKNRGAKILTYKQLKHEFDVASLLFSGRETDSNWEIRQAFFEKVKGFLSSEDAKIHKKELLDKIHEVIPGIYNTVKSVRTTLIEEALSLVEAIGTYVGDSLNMHTNEAILRFLMNESSVTKRAIASRAFEATNNYLTRVRFRPMVLIFLCKRAQDKNPQLREFALGYIKTVLSVHGSANKSRLIEHADLTQAIASSLQKGLVDAAPTVRSACKETYYVFEEHWPTSAYEFASKLDIAIQRRLGVNIGQLSSATSKSTKPLLRRTSKFTASAIKKPASSIGINRAAKLDIKAAMQKPINPASLIASKPYTHGFNLSNRAITKPAQTPTSAAMPPPGLSPNTNSQGLPPDVNSQGAPSNSNLQELPSNLKARELSPNASSQGSYSNTNSQELSPNIDSQEQSSSNSSQELPSDSNPRELSWQPTKPSSMAAEDLPHAVKIPSRRGSRVMPSPTSSSSNEGSKSPLHLTKKTPAGAIKKPVSPHSISPTAKLVAKARSAMSPISDIEVLARSSSVSNKISTVATAKQPHQSGPATQRRSGLLPAGSASKPHKLHTLASKDSKSFLHLTKKTPAGIIRKPVSPHSVSQAARAIKSSCNAASSISSTEISAISNSVSSKSPSVANAKQPRQSDLAAQRRPGLLPAGSALKPQTPHTISTRMPSPTPSTSNKSSTASSITKSPRPKLRKSVNLSKKYDHITSRYKNIPAHRK
ncbi:hypothetical protein MAM1_0141c06418 [Mucor ambiguus]|uniref:TOG domain-containing protein n=1 Tax=Mucor ambiguus TaxID=91626 RepID=A0A0C9MXK7_9FUNG|nr:hypothetical protein MAM1_0141c06418 [Mucor ambiguus]